MSEKTEAWSDEELVGILEDWHRYAHGGNMIGACNNEKCQAALAEITVRIPQRSGPSEAEVEEWIKKKATIMDDIIQTIVLNPSVDTFAIAEGFINSLAQKFPMRKPKMSIKIFDDIDSVHYYLDRKRMFKRKLEEAGFEVE